MIIRSWLSDYKIITTYGADDFVKDSDNGKPILLTRIQYGILCDILTSIPGISMLTIRRHVSV